MLLPVELALVPLTTLCRDSALGSGLICLLIIEISCLSNTEN